MSEVVDLAAELRGNRPPDRLREMTGAAWETSRCFARAFESVAWHTAAGRGVDRETRLYAICEEDGGNWKFGVAVKPAERLGTLQIGNPRRLVLYAHTPARLWMERFVHHALRRQRLMGEWFKASPRTLTVAHLIEVAQEQIWDMEKYGDDGPCDIDETIAALCSRFDEAFA